MSKRLFDITVAGGLLLLTLPLLVAAMLAIYCEDRHWPVFSQPRAGQGGRYFRVHKLRTMFYGADRFAVDVTPSDDQRITKVGAILRRTKLDELLQLWNVLLGDMSLVGPRPQVEREVQRYTEAERGLLAVRPGITDFSSIVFMDLSDVIEGSPDPNLAYSQLIRPWKSRLGLFYAAHATLPVDVALIILTPVSFVWRQAALRGVAWLLTRLHAPAELIEVSLRQKPLVPTPPPGSDAIVTSRD
jgi:lipopolysaccharide/colanic/teichoic acid biosynthesis glycosyltransferase